CSGSTHIDEISYALGVKPAAELETDLQPFRMRARVHWCAPMDDSPEVIGLLYEAAKGVSRFPRKEMVLIVAHGSKEKGFHKRWREVLDSVAKQLKGLGGFAAVDYAMLLPDQASCVLRGWNRRRP